MPAVGELYAIITTARSTRRLSLSTTITSDANEDEDDDDDDEIGLLWLLATHIYLAVGISCMASPSPLLQICN